MVFGIEKEWFIFFLVTIISPFLLFNGITSLGVHEVYVWYMMSPTSLFCAIASFVGILILYILTLPTVYSILRGRKPEKIHCPVPDSIPHHDKHPVHDHDKDKMYDAVLLSAVLALQKQLQPVVETKETEKEDTSKPLKYDKIVVQLQQISELKKDEVMTDEEYKMLRKEIFEDLIKMSTDKGRDS